MSDKTPLACICLPSPVGRLRLASFDGRLAVCAWEGSRDCQAQLKRLCARAGIGEIKEAATAVLDQAALELEEYFTFKRRRFTVPLDLAGTPFQLLVWRFLATIPYGRWVSYAQVAAAIGRPKAIRAAATAVGDNPLSILIPCHRVLASGGRLGGFAGGLEAKRRLLKLEAIAFKDTKKLSIK